MSGFARRNASSLTATAGSSITPTWTDRTSFSGVGAGLRFAAIGSEAKEKGKSEIPQVFTLLAQLWLRCICRPMRNAR
jgi:hypothetical protein